MNISDAYSLAGLCLVSTGHIEGGLVAVAISILLAFRK